MNNELGLSDLLRAQHVQRWHIVNTSRPQTLAEHNYNVATIAMALHNNLTEEGVPYEYIAVLAMAALYHDAVEVRTGDIPTPGKNLIEMFSNENVFDNIDAYLVVDTPFVGVDFRHPRFNGLRHIIKMADYIEAACWIRENGVGQIAKEVADRCWQLMEDYVDKLVETTPDGLVWCAAVNTVLSAMLCPPLRSKTS